MMSGQASPLRVSAPSWSRFCHQSSTESSEDSFCSSSAAVRGICRSSSAQKTDAPDDSPVAFHGAFYAIARAFRNVARHRQLEASFLRFLYDGLRNHMF